MLSSNVTVLAMIIASGGPGMVGENILLIGLWLLSPVHVCAFAVLAILMLGNPPSVVRVDRACDCEV